MVVEPISTCLAVVALTEPIYRACNEMYDGCQKMRNFGPEVQMLYLELQGLYTLLKILMRRPFGDLECRFSSADLEGRFDSASEEMKNVIDILTRLQTHFTVCNGIIEGVLKNADLGNASPLHPVQRPAHVSQTAHSIKNASSGANGTLHGPRVSLHARLAGRAQRIKSFCDQITRPTSTANASTAMSSPSTAHASLTTSPPNVSAAIPAIHLGGSTVQPISKSDPASKKARSDTSYPSLIKWAHHTQRDFEERLARIRSCIQDLNICLPLRQIQEPTHIFGRRHRVPSATCSSLKDQTAIRILHSSLSAVNPKRWHIGVGVFESFQKTWEKFNTDSGTDQHPGDLIVNLQGHEAAAHESTFMMVELTARHSASSSEKIEDISHFNTTNTSTIAQGQYAVLGSLECQDSPNRIFAETRPWQKLDSLKDRLQEPGFLRSLDPLSLIKLSRMILKAFLDFSKIRDECRGPQAEDFLFYKEPNYSNASDVDDDPESKRLRPYWSNGFGVPDSVSSTGHEPDSAIAKLGHLLYQLGSHTVGLPMDWKDARDYAKSALAQMNNEVDKKYGSIYGDVVHTCLMSNAQNAAASVDECIKKLDELEDTVVVCQRHRELHISDDYISGSSTLGSETGSLVADTSSVNAPAATEPIVEAPTAVALTEESPSKTISAAGTSSAEAVPTSLSPAPASPAVSLKKVSTIEVLSAQTIFTQASSTGVASVEVPRAGEPKVETSSSELPSESDYGGALDPALPPVEALHISSAGSTTCVKAFTEKVPYAHPLPILGNSGEHKVDEGDVHDFRCADELESCAAEPKSASSASDMVSIH